MEPVKVSMPQSGTLKTGLVQFGNELPGIYITAEDAFALKIDIDGLEAEAMNLGSVDEESEVDEINSARSEVEWLTSELTAKLDHLRRHRGARSEEHTSELKSLMRISYAVF